VALSPGPGTRGPTEVGPPESGPHESGPHQAGSEGAAWELVIAFDPELQRGADIPEPAPSPGAYERVIKLHSGLVTIGRASAARGEVPDVDLSSPGGDPGVSHRHAQLERDAHGAWTVVDNNSLNGTFLNDAELPLPVGQPVPIAPGDVVHLGAWTSFSVRPAGASNHLPRESADS
jgi:hypothetical protein